MSSQGVQGHSDVSRSEQAWMEYHDRSLGRSVFRFRCQANIAVAKSEFTVARRGWHDELLMEAVAGYVCLRFSAS